MVHLDRNQEIHIDFSVSLKQVSFISSEALSIFLRFERPLRQQHVNNLVISQEVHRLGFNCNDSYY